MENNEKYGLLLNSNIKLNRQYFREMVKLHGIYVLYRAPLPGKHWTNYAEIDTNFAPPIKIGCIYHNYVDQKTLTKAGWVAELQEGSSLIEVDYDTPNLRQGALFIIPSGLDDGNARLFRVVAMQNIAIYPASITCEIVPEYEDTLDSSTVNDYHATDFNLISEEHDTHQFLEGDESGYLSLSDDEEFL